MYFTAQSFFIHFKNTIHFNSAMFKCFTVKYLSYIMVPTHLFHPQKYDTVNKITN